MDDVLREKFLSVAARAAMVLLPMSGGALAASVVPQTLTAGYGTLFELTKKGVDSTLYTYPECEDAGGIQGVGVGIVKGPDGYAYGVNVGGCSNDNPYGSVYRFILPN